MSIEDEVVGEELANFRLSVLDKTENLWDYGCINANAIVSQIIVVDQTVSFLRGCSGNK